MFLSVYKKSPKTSHSTGLQTFHRQSAAFFTGSDSTCHLHISCCYVFHTLCQKFPEPFFLVDSPDRQVNVVFTGHTDKFFCSDFLIDIYRMDPIFSARSADPVRCLFIQHIFFGNFLIDVGNIFLDIPEYLHLLLQ